MDPRKFNNAMKNYHHAWAAEVLGMYINESNEGPDIFDNNKFVELKFGIIKPKLSKKQQRELKKKGKKRKPDYPKSWTVLEHQMSYELEYGIRGYWGLGFYELTKAVSSIDAIDQFNLERLVISRELHLIPWDWMTQFKASKTQGKTERSKWKNTFRYPKYKLFPKSKETIEVNKGKVQILYGINKETFFPSVEELATIPF